MFKKSDVKSFIKSLTDSTENVRENIVKGLEKGEYIIYESSQTMIPYDSGDAFESWFSEIDNQPKEITLTVGYDKEGRLADYLPLVHETPPETFADPNMIYSPEGWKMINDKPFAHDPQIHFLLKGMEQNWDTIRTEYLKVNFDKE